MLCQSNDTIFLLFLLFRLFVVIVLYILIIVLFHSFVLLLSESSGTGKTRRMCAAWWCSSRALSSTWSPPTWLAPAPAPLLLRAPRTWSTPSRFVLRVKELRRALRGYWLREGKGEGEGEAKERKCEGEGVGEIKAKGAWEWMELKAWVGIRRGKERENRKWEGEWKWWGEGQYDRGRRKGKDKVWVRV